MILKVVLTMVHVAVSIVLILVVLLQTGKRADLAGAFGGGGSQTAFGARGAATLLSKATTVCAVVFMITSLGLSIMSSKGEASGTVLEGVETPPASSAPATPGPSPAENVPATPASPVPADEASGGTPSEGTPPGE